MLHANRIAQAEAFIDKIIAPQREAAMIDQMARRERAELARAERALAGAELSKHGIDADRLDEFAKTRSGPRLKLAEEERRRAIERSAAIGDLLAERASLLLPADPSDVVLDQVTFIRSFAGQGSVVDQNIAPGDNWARYRLQSTSDLWDGTGRLSFFTLWQNPADTNSIVRVTPNLIVNARLACDAEWSGIAAWFGLGSEARGAVRARTSVWGMQSSVASVVDDRLLGEVSVSGGFFGDDASRSIQFSGIIEGSGVVVPAQAFVLIEVEIATEWTASLASVVLDAESGSHRVTVPQIVLGGVTRPTTPGAITLSVSASPVPGGTIATLLWSGATGARVDIYQNGTKVADTENDGSWTTTVTSGSYQFRVCELGSSLCSIDAVLTVP